MAKNISDKQIMEKSDVGIAIDNGDTNLSNVIMAKITSNYNKGFDVVKTTFEDGTFNYTTQDNGLAVNGINPYIQAIGLKGAEKALENFAKASYLGKKYFDNGVTDKISSVTGLDITREYAQELVAKSKLAHPFAQIRAEANELKDYKALYSTPSYSRDPKNVVKKDNNQNGYLQKISETNNKIEEILKFYKDKEDILLEESKSQLGQIVDQDLVNAYWKRQNKKPLDDNEKALLSLLDGCSQKKSIAILINAMDVMSSTGGLAGKHKILYDELIVMRKALEQAQAAGASKEITYTDPEHKALIKETNIFQQQKSYYQYSEHGEPLHPLDGETARKILTQLEGKPLVGGDFGNDANNHLYSRYIVNNVGKVIGDNIGRN